MSEGISRKKILYPETPGEPIARSLRALRERTLAVPISPENADDIEIPAYEKIKTETYALTAYAIERVHEKAMRKIEEQPDSFTTKNWLRFPVPDIEHTHEFDLRRASVDFEYAQSAIGHAEYAYSSAFLDALQEWSNAAKIGQGEASYDHKVYSRLSDLIIETNVASSRNIGATHQVESFIMRGANTVGDVSFDILRAIPIAYYAKFGRIITQDEFHDIARQAETLVLQLSSMHIDSFSNLLRFSRSGSLLNKQMLLEFPLEFFVIEEVNGRPRLNFDAESLKAFETYRSHRPAYIQEETRLGCPARDARISEGRDGSARSVVSSVYGYYMNLAEDLIVPHLEPYTDYVLEKGTKPPRAFSLD